MSNNRRRLLVLAATVAALLPQALAPASTGAPGSRVEDSPCAWWYAIGDRPADDEATTAARRYDVVVLNAWEGAYARRLKQLNPDLKVLVYKDFASARNYPGTADQGRDADLLPTGVGWVEAETADPAWFAHDTNGDRIEWNGYPGHWQMAVWHPDYQRRWVDNVVAEVLREGWDGVLADNDMWTLRWYSDRIISGTGDRASSDALLRRGLAELLHRARQALTGHGRELVPNLSEAHQQAGRWREHATGGAMDEQFALPTDHDLLPLTTPAWAEMRDTAPTDRTLLMTRGTDARVLRTGYAAAALLAGPATCWATTPTADYTVPGWTHYQDLRLGTARGPALREPNGAWTRSFTHGWVAVNPGPDRVVLRVPSGFVDADTGRTPATTLRVAPRDAVVLVSRPARSAPGS